MAAFYFTHFSMIIGSIMLHESFYDLFNSIGKGLNQNIVFINKRNAKSKIKEQQDGVREMV